MRGAVALLTWAAVSFPLTAALFPNEARAQDDAQLVRIATFNASLNRATEGQLVRDLATPDNAQARVVAEIIQRVRPDILLLQEFDYDERGAALRSFQSNYLAVGQNGQEPIKYEHVFFTVSNTGMPSGLDLDNDGRVAGGGDSLGFGEFPGQYAMALLSRFPIDRAHARTFRKFLWRDMPEARLPDDPKTPAPADWYTAEELAKLPLSSKSHWDVPIEIGDFTLHVLASHPTPPAFDGPEDRNGLRNHDEIRFWTDYLTPKKARYIHDDAGRRGGWDGKSAFVILGDLNSDPVDGASLHEGIQGLMAHESVDARAAPRSAGAVEAGTAQGGVNATQRGDPTLDTADFNDRAAGNLRVDYLLPRVGLAVCGTGVFWPRSEHPLSRLVWGNPPPSSDHRLVWLDLNAGGDGCPPDSDRIASDPSRPGR